MQTPRVAILTEAGPDVGLGHLGRCVALYDALHKLSAACRLVVAGTAPGHVVGDRTVELAEWRAVDSVAALVRGDDIVVIDSYIADVDVYVAATAEATVGAYLDDTARLPYPPGFVVNGNPDASALPFREAPGTTPLLGVTYQLLRAEFVGVGPRTVDSNVGRVLVIAGGGNAAEVRAGLAHAAELAFPLAVIDLVDAPRTAEHMRESMLAADIAVSAAGQTLYELAATGTPTVAVCVADNQEAQAAAFEKAGALRLAGNWSTAGVEARLAHALGDLTTQLARVSVSTRAQQLVDGAGAQRVAGRLVRALADQERSAE